MSKIVAYGNKAIVKFNPGTRLVVVEPEKDQHYINFKDDCQKVYGSVVNVQSNEYQNAAALYFNHLFKLGSNAMLAPKGSIIFAADSKHYHVVYMQNGYYYPYGILTSSSIYHAIGQTPKLNLKVAPDKWNATLPTYRFIEEQIQKYKNESQIGISKEANDMVLKWTNIFKKMGTTTAFTPEEKTIMHSPETKFIIESFENDSHVSFLTNPQFWTIYAQNIASTQLAEQSAIEKIIETKSIETTGTMLPDDYVPSQKGQFIKFPETATIMTEQEIATSCQDINPADHRALYHHLIVSESKYEVGFTNFLDLKPSRILSYVYYCATKQEDIVESSTKEPNNNKDIDVD